ncbi:hypothetical protein [Serinibacter arcticus]|uniref:Uncharacterized protein n=1 Tax=Serinibacter arcticus TaxID=1655435 RepID=A0A4Z1EAP9_9MICO|nr:hypothetical protein [Serinibacter arcticus]TGO06547.1 hypothetical protein SERN_0739 [Serinibacter arcticus]
MSITAMQPPAAGPTNARPHLRLLPDLRPSTSLPTDLTTIAGAPRHEHLQPHPLPSSGRRPLDLDTVRIETDLLARSASRTVGILATWGRSRWRAAGNSGAGKVETIASTFDVCVNAPTPCLDVARRISDRLAADGWMGGIRAMTPIVRIDGVRDGYHLRLVATRRTLALRVSSAPIVVGEKLAQQVLDGLYEEE